MNTSAKIVKTFPQSKTLKAVANLYFDDCFVIHGVKVIDSEKGMFVAMPSVQVSGTPPKDGRKYKDICHPLNSETRRQINDIDLAAYQEVTASAKENTESEEDTGHEKENEEDENA